MTIRKKILISNILMIFIPILVTFIIVGATLEGVAGSYWETIEAMYKDKNGLYSIQSIIFEYKNEIANTEWKNYGNNNEDNSIKTKRMRDLEQELTNRGYHFSIIVNKELFFNNITDNEKKVAYELLGQDFENSDSFMFSKNNISIIKNSFNKGEKCEILAIHTPENAVNTKSQSYLRKYMFKYILILVFCIITMIIITNLLLSRWISKSILIPLKKLSIGSQKIIDGDLDFYMDYTKDDEFGEVCKDFDEMRGHLKAAVEERLRYERYRNELLAGISHDLRTPLTSIKGYIEGLIEGIANTKEKQERYYKAIHIRTDDMEKLVDNLSVYTHLENKKESFNFELIELNQYIKETLEKYEVYINNNNMEVTCSYYNDSLFVSIDCQKIHRVILNILSNSVKYRIKNKSNINLEISKKGNNAVIKIQDDGPGIKLDDLQHIFECFYRGDASRTKPGEGSGLGLSIAKQIVEGHNGKILAKNMNGLCIEISLPLKEDKYYEKDFDC